MAKKSLDPIDAMYEIAEAAQPITGRGVGYKLFSGGLIPSMATSDMRSVYRLLKEARERDISDLERFARILFVFWRELHSAGRANDFFGTGRVVPSALPIQFDEAALARVLGHVFFAEIGRHGESLARRVDARTTVFRSPRCRTPARKFCRG